MKQICLFFCMLMVFASVCAAEIKIETITVEFSGKQRTNPAALLRYLSIK